MRGKLCEKYKVLRWGNVRGVELGIKVSEIWGRNLKVKSVG